jgi:hypothetical protein
MNYIVATIFVILLGFVAITFCAFLLTFDIYPGLIKLINPLLFGEIFMILFLLVAIFVEILRAGGF